MQVTKQKFSALALMLALSTGPQFASAATVTLTGDTVAYEYDDAVNAAAIALLGTPTISGDVIRFLPPDLRAESVDGSGIDSVSAEFTFDRIYALGNAEIGGIEVTEFGDYEIINGGNASAELKVAITNNSNTAEMIEDTVDISASGDSGGLQEWTLISTLNPADGFLSSADDVSMTFRNTLTASTDSSGQISYVQKKLSFLVSTELAEPGSLGLFAIGLAAALFARRRPC